MTEEYYAYSIKEDWYKINVVVSSTITVHVYCDPDLMVSVVLYKGSSSKDTDQSTSRGDDCYVSYSGTADYYYVRVKLTGSYGDKGYPGDYYDIEIEVSS